MVDLGNATTSGGIGRFPVQVTTAMNVTPNPHVSTGKRRAEHALQTALHHRYGANGAPNADVLSSLSADELADASLANGVDDYAADWLSMVAPESDALAAIRRRCDAMARFHLRALADLRTLHRAFDDAGIAHLVMKGPVLNELRSGPFVRPYSDLDVLIDPGTLRAALDALERCGAEPIEGWLWQHLLETEHGQVPMVLPFGTSLDLHWHLCSRPTLRWNFSVEFPSALLLRSVPFEVGGGLIPVLSPVDMLLHTASHATWSGGDRLVWSGDVADVIEGFDVEWDVLVDRAHAWGVGNLVAEALRQATREAGASVPETVITALRVGGWGRVLAVIDRPRLRRFLGRHDLPMLLRSDMRGDSRTSARLFRGRVTNAIRRRAGHVAPELTRPQGRADSRARYFEFVERETREGFRRPATRIVGPGTVD